jgi:hypothetical protein
LKRQNPKFDIIIGKGVERIVGNRLKFPSEAIDLPSAYLNKQRQEENYRRYNEICNAVLNGRPVPPRVFKKARTKESHRNLQKIIVQKPPKGYPTIVAVRLVSLGYSARRKYSNTKSKS